MRDLGHIVAYRDGEVRQDYEVILLGRPVNGIFAVNDGASDVVWIEPGKLAASGIFPAQSRQPRDYLNQSWPQVD
jgi:hypothetical protein